VTLTKEFHKSDSNFEKLIDKEPISVVLFKTNMCENCVDAMVNLHFLKEKNIPIHVVDVMKDKILSEKYSVEVVPTVVIFRDGRVQHHLQGRRNKFEYQSKLKQSSVI